MSDKEWTLVELLNTTRQYLSEKNIENPRGNVEALLGNVLNLPRIQLYLQHDRPISDSELETFRSLIRRRLRHEPLQLILGEVDFCGIKLKVIPGTLIPRPETEELALRVLDEIALSQADCELRLLDIGCGTGCLSVCMVTQNKSIFVDAVDIDSLAIQCTQSNAEKNGVSSRVNTIQADLFDLSFLSRIHPPYDIVISNPPYVSEKEYELLEPEIREFEPKHALVALKDGYSYYEQISKLIPNLLRKGGLLALEIGIEQSPRILEMFQNSRIEFTVHNDLAGIPRMLIGRKQ